jgi:tRNA-specific 2-thiouridylase
MQQQNNSNKKNKKVFVGLSGGVDSSVSAALLKEQGYDVTGVFIKVWHPDWLPCEWKEERRDAMRVAASLQIPFMTLDLQQEYKQGVVDYMLREYAAGRTPNPDVMCNKEVKFGAFLKKALELGADYVATGHYAQVVHEENYSKMLENPDITKDQTYFLWTLGQHELKHTLFPVGHLYKKGVRVLAEKYNLPTAEKKDSQGICFIGKIDMKEFLSHYIPQKIGDVVDETGKIIGSHDGAFFYTIGQRHGFSIINSAKTSHDAAFYIIKKDIEKNQLVVAHKKSEESTVQNITTVTLDSIHSIREGMLIENKKYYARVRYHQKPQVCTLSGNTVHFELPQDGVSLGQSVVFYSMNDQECLGGGVIQKLF